METKECIYCMSHIPMRAKKCCKCLEWQDDHVLSAKEPEENKNDDIAIKFSDVKKPFQLSLVEKIPLHYTVTISIIGIIIFVLIQFSWYRLDEERIYLFSFLTFTIQMAFCWSGLIWISTVINENYNSFIQVSSAENDSSEKLFLRYHKMMFKRSGALLAGFFTGLVASIGDYMVGTPFISFEAKFIFAGFEFLIMFFAGAAVYSMAVFGFFLYQITSNPDKNSLLRNKNNYVNNIGSIHLKTSVLAIVPLFLGVLAKLFGDWNWDILNILWYGSFALIIVVYIYWPMIHIHKLMKQDIEKQVTILHNKIQNLLVEIGHSPSSRNFIKLNELRQIRRSISNQNTWPFDTKSVSAAFFAIIFPLALIVIDKFWTL